MVRYRRGQEARATAQVILQRPSGEDPADVATAPGRSPGPADVTPLEQILHSHPTFYLFIFASLVLYSNFQVGVSDLLCFGHVLRPHCGLGCWEGCFTFWFLEVGTTSHKMNMVGSSLKEGFRMLGS